MHCLLPTYSNKLEVNNIHLVRGYGEPTDFGRNQNQSCLVISEYRVSQSMLDFFTIQHILNLNIFPLTHTEKICPYLDSSSNFPSENLYFDYDRISN